MALSVETERMLAAKFEVLFPHLDERQRRLWMGAEARTLGHGGSRRVDRRAWGRGAQRRTGQFRYINENVKGYQAAGDPVVSVDTKKKELVGQFSNAGRQWRPTGEPVTTLTHDFPDDSLGKAVPYGIYDLAAEPGGSMSAPT